MPRVEAATHARARGAGWPRSRSAAFRVARVRAWAHERAVTDVGEAAQRATVVDQRLAAAGPAAQDFGQEDRMGSTAEGVTDDALQVGHGFPDDRQLGR